jgi:aminoglycoside phosphotransferase (APT) family kinase protein
LLDIPRLVGALNQACHRVIGDRHVYASDEEAIAATLALMETRLVRGRENFDAWTGRLASYLGTLTSRLDLPGCAPDLADDLESLRERLLAADPQGKAELDAAEKSLLTAWGLLSARLNADARLPQDERDRMAVELAEAELLRTQERMGVGGLSGAADDTEITAERLAAYLADRFDDASIEVSQFRRLPGGYGKETTLFSVHGRAFSGDYVMRRDRDTPTIDNDCHRIANETPVIQAVFARGFPAPEAMWCDTEHALLKGGDFLIMKRAPGTAGGDVFGSSGKVSDALTSLLATSVGRLHSLPQMRDLGDLTSGIHSALWDKSCKEVTTAYITSFRDLYLQEMAEPSPAVLGLFGYLLTNVPDAPGKPILLHGDVGFHNFIVDDGELSAVVDWEFAHIGDPADDIGYIANTVGGSLDWGRFLELYKQAGGIEIDPERLRFFRIWGHLRNLTACQLSTNAYEIGRLHDIKIAHVGHSMTPMFLNAIRSVFARP